MLLLSLTSQFTNVLLVRNSSRHKHVSLQRELFSQPTQKELHFTQQKLGERSGNLHRMKCGQISACVIV